MLGLGPGDSFHGAVFDKLSERIVNYGELQQRLAELGRSPERSLKCAVELSGADGSSYYEFSIRPIIDQTFLGQVMTVRDNTRIQQLLNTLDNAERVLVSLAKAIETRDQYLEGHGERSAQLAAVVAQSLGLPQESQEVVRMGMLLHDIGKIGIPDSILKKPGPLAAPEREIIKQHPVLGGEICRPLQSLRNILPIIRNHHEKLDGSGYPDGLEGNHLALEVRIACVVDIYDALISERVYRPKFPKQEAFAILRKGVEDGQLEPRVVEALIAAQNRRSGDLVS